VLFYDIEYGIVQLRAVAVWKRYQENPTQGLRDYLDALRFGYTHSVPQVYQKAGIAFELSRAYQGPHTVFENSYWGAWLIACVKGGSALHRITKKLLTNLCVLSAQHAGRVCL